MGAEIIRKCLEQTTVPEILEGLRKQLVVAMRNGQTFVIDIGKSSPDFSDTDQYCTLNEEDWAADTIFD